MYKGVATIEIIDKKTGKIEKTVEHNQLSSLYNDIFKSNQLDGVINYNSNIKDYFKKCVLLTKTPNKSGSLLDDDVHVIASKTADITNTYDDTGLEMVFYFDGADIYDGIQCIALAPTSFTNLEMGTGSSSLISGKFEGKINLGDEETTGGFKIVNIDFDNNWIYSLETKSRGDYKKGQPFYAYFRKYYHNFNAPALTTKDVFSMKLLESTEIDLTEMLSDVNGIGYTNPLNYAVDELNKRIILIYNDNKNTFRTCVFSIDNTADVQFYNMTLPSYVKTDGYGIRSNSNYMFQIPSYNGRVCIPTKLILEEGDKECYIGINPFDTTDLEIYEIVYIETLKRPLIDADYSQLLGTGTGSAICSKVLIKDGFAFSVYNNSFNTANFYHKSKQMTVWGTDSIYIEYKMPAMIISTINELTSEMHVASDKELKITYRITQRG